MTIKTKYAIGDRIMFFSDDYKRNFKGTIIEISAIVDRYKEIEIDYAVEADEIIKNTRMHTLIEATTKIIKLKS